MEMKPAPLDRSEAGVSYLHASIGYAGHNTEALQTQYLADNYLLKRRRAELIASLHYGEIRDVE